MRAVLGSVSSLSSFLVVGLIGLAPAVRAQAPLEGADLVSALQGGGHVIYLRHAATDSSQADSSEVDYADWTTQRNLSDKGRQQAREIGAAFRALGIPVDDVVTSPFCRCIETAELAFGKSTVSEDLAFAIRTTKSEAKRLSRALQKMLRTPPAPGTNTVLIAHTANLKEAANIWPKPEGILVVFKPVESDQFAFIGVIKPDQWSQLVAEAGVEIRAADWDARVVEPSAMCAAAAQRGTDETPAAPAARRP